MRFLTAVPPSYASFVTSQNAVLRMTQTMSAVSGINEDQLPSLRINELVGALMQEEASRAASKITEKSQVLYA